MANNVNEATPSRVNEITWITQLKNKCTTPPDFLRGAKANSRLDARTPVSEVSPAGLPVLNVSSNSVVDMNEVIDQFRIIMSGLLDQKMATIDDKVASISNSVASISAGLSSLQNAHTALSESVEKENQRLEAALRAQDQRIEVLSTELHCCAREVQNLKSQSASTTANTASGPTSAVSPVPSQHASAAARAPHQVCTMNDVRTLITEHDEVAKRRNNVVLVGIIEKKDEKLPDIVKQIYEISDQPVTAYRIGRRSDSTDAERPRLVLLKTTEQAKDRIMGNQRKVTYEGHSVYANHDLTPSEQQQRREAVPTYKLLRTAGIKCSLPRTVILKDGKPMSDEDIAIALKPSSSNTAEGTA